MLIAELLQQGKQELEKNGIATAALDVQLLLGYCLDKGRTELFLDASAPVSSFHDQQFRTLIQRRSLHEPVAYLLGEREFWSLPFHVNGDVLIPRPETEFLLEKVLQKTKHNHLRVGRALDLCCGSGVIAVVLALELGAEIVGVDLSAAALAVTDMNCRRHGVEKQVSLLCADLFSGFSSSLRFPLIVSNPPYVSEYELYEKLDREVAVFEPHLALSGGVDGLDVVRRIAADILDHLTPGGMFIMEFAADQGRAVVELFSAARKNGRYFDNVEIFQDYSGRDRVLAVKVNEYCE